MTTQNDETCRDAGLFVGAQLRWAMDPRNASTWKMQLRGMCEFIRTCISLNCVFYVDTSLLSKTA